MNWERLDKIMLRITLGLALGLIAYLGSHILLAMLR